MTESGIEPGTRLREEVSFVVGRELGSGGFGTVYEGQDEQLKRPVAIKILHAHLTRDATIVKRFLREARTMAALRHPNLVQIYCVSSTTEGRPFLVMELLEGESVDELFERQGKLAPLAAVELMLPALRGLAAMHRSGFVHRDFKPANVFIPRDRDGHALETKVLDFGIAKAVEGQSALTEGVVGTFTYMAPEQFTSGPPIPQMDVYAAGVTLYALLSGDWPYAEEDAPIVIRKVTQGDRAPLASVAPHVPADLVAIVEQALALDPAQRQTDAGTLADVLDRWRESALGGGPAHGTAPTIAAGPAGPARVPKTVASYPVGIQPAPEAVGEASPDALPDGVPRRRFPFLALVVVAFALGVVAVLGALIGLRAFGVDITALGLGPGESTTLRAEVSASASASAAPTPCPSGMVAIAGGEFSMGSTDGDADERPPHPVTLSPFCVDRTEVTVAAYGKCVLAGQCPPPATEHTGTGYSPAEAAFQSRYCNGGRADRRSYPMNCVNWAEASGYCRWKDARLPTEAQWEFAARGVTGRRYPWGDSPPSEALMNGMDPLYSRALADAGRPVEPLFRQSDGHGGTAPVGSYPRGATPEGVVDLAGNVWEWVRDHYGAYPSKAQRDPEGPPEGTYRISRGGSFRNRHAKHFRGTERVREVPEDRLSNVGFRCAAPQRSVGEFDR